MKQLLAIMLYSIILSSCCGLVRDTQYDPPKTTTVQTSTISYQSKSVVWDELIYHLKRLDSPFTVNSMNESQGIIQISYSVSPSPYVDCGMLSTEFDNAGHTYDRKFMKPLFFRTTYPASTDFLEYTVCEDTDIPWESCKLTHKRTLTLEASAIIRVVELSKTTRVDVKAIYTLTKKLKIYDQATGLFQGQTYQTISFDSYSQDTYHDEQITCKANGMLENHIIGIIP